MANKRDYYEVLGISKDATDQDIKSSFRKLSRKWHPDMQSSKTDAEKKDAEEKFKEIAEAYEVLSDKSKRANYDQFGFEGQNNFSSSGMDMHDFMRRHASMFGDMFEDFGMFGFGHSHQHQPPNPNQPQDGRNIQIQVEVTFKESVSGCTKEFDINLSDPCPECNGTGVEAGSLPIKCNTCHGSGMVTQNHGFMVMSSTCPTCNGSGYSIQHCKHCNGNRRISVKKHLKIKIPQGVDNGQRLRLLNSGECGVCGGSNGNLYINIVVHPSDIFERHGINLNVNVPISPILATLGGKIEVPTPYGYVKTTVPAGIQSGYQHIVHDKGMKLNGNVGNLIVTFVIEALSNLTAEQKELLKKLQDTIVDDNLIQTKAAKTKFANYYK